MLKTLKLLLTAAGHVRDRALAVFMIALQRVVAQRGLAIATLAGLIVTIGLTLSIPIYAEGIYYRLLSEGMFASTPLYRGDAARPPVSLLFRYVSSFTGPRQWEETVALDTYLRDEVYRYLHLPPSPEAHHARLLSTGIFGFFHEQDADVLAEKMPVIRVGLSAISEPEAHLKLVEGAFPAAQPAGEGPLEVMVSPYVADKMGIQPGDRYIAYDLRALHRYEDTPARFDLVVTGVWEPAKPNAEFWEYSQVHLDTMAFVSEAAFANRVAPALSDEINQAIWYLPMDASTIYADEIDDLLLRLNDLQHDVQAFLPNTIMDPEPVKVLQTYREAVSVLSVLLFAFSVPVISLILTFIGLVVALNIERQRRETASLRSRGATVQQILGIATVESGLLALLSLLVALPLSLLLARVIGQTRTFMEFSVASDLRVGVTWGTLRFGVVVVAITLAAQVLPLITAARQTIVSYHHERARRLRPPWWQRTGLDLLLALPAGYGAYLLRTQGSVFDASPEAAADPFQNPLLFLVPALTLLAATLIVLRVLPLLLRVAAWLLGLTENVGILMAVRQLARAPGLYTAPLALLILTLGLSTYSASLAATMDRHLRDQQHYYVGADASLVDTGDPVGQSPSSSPIPPPPPTQWTFLPVSEYVKLPGIEGAARVGRYASHVQTGSGFVDGTYIGVDRADFSRAAFWRDDFAEASLGELMNLLATRFDAILLPREFMADNFITLGDRVEMTVVAYDKIIAVTGIVVGSFDYFPSWYPETGPLVVGNLEHFFQEAFGQIPYQVWFDTAEGVDYTELERELWRINLGAQQLVAADDRILEEQERPERQGLLGLLSVGFGIAAILTAIGFLLYALFSFRRRAVELGVLRATGLPAREMAVFVGSELALLLLVGGAAGSGLGIWASRAFVPYLQVGGDMLTRVPPFVVEIEWPALFRIYGLFGVLFVVTLAILVRLLRQMKLFQAIKLGETL